MVQSGALMITAADGVNLCTDGDVRVSRLNSQGLLEYGMGGSGRKITMEEAA